MDNIRYWIALEQSDGIGPAHLKEIHKTLFDNNLSILDLFDLNSNEIKQEFHLSDKLANSIVNSKELLSKVEDDYFKLLDNEIKIIPFYSDNYPAHLLETMGNTIPPLLYTYGNIDILKMHGIAILGDRNVSDKGSEISYMAAKELSLHKISVISGLANGADMVAHRSALENNGYTIAVVPYGIFHLKIPEFLKDVFNPDRILIISTFYPSKEINKFNAFIRNKIICALSYAVYIVESPIDGGIFESGKSADKLGIPIFTTGYKEFPENALGNKRLLEEFGATAIHGKQSNDTIVPNMEKIIGIAKFTD